MLNIVAVVAMNTAPQFWHLLFLSVLWIKAILYKVCRSAVRTSLVIFMGYQLILEKSKIKKQAGRVRNDPYPVKTYFFSKLDYYSE